MKKVKLLITGSKGQLGSEIREISKDYPEYEFFFTSRAELDISEQEEVNRFLTSNEVDVVVNCAAYTAVDKAEVEPEIADKINHLAVKNLAGIAKEKGIGLIHISTDYVFNGQGFRPYPTDHPTDPVNMYGKTKLDGENALKEIAPANSMIIRTSWVYSSYGNNFVKTMLRLGEDRKELKVISDQVGTPTYAKDLARFILTEAVKARNKKTAVYHFSNEGICAWYDFAKEIMEQANLGCVVKPIPTSEYPTPAKRPYYSLMDKSHLSEEFNYSIPHWKESLKNCIEKIVSSSGVENKQLNKIFNNVII